MSTRDNRPAKRARKTTDSKCVHQALWEPGINIFPVFAELPFHGVKYLDLLTPHDSAMRAAPNNLHEAEANLRLRMQQARFHNARMKNRYFDLFTAEEMQDVQMIDEAEVNADRQRAVLDVALERFYMAIEQLKNTKKVVKKLRRNWPSGIVW